jgi:hypothetical protein
MNATDAQCCFYMATQITSAIVTSLVAIGAAAWVVCTRPRPRAPPTKKVTYHRAREGKKLHLDRDCQALANAVGVVAHEISAETVKELYLLGDLCVRCSAPHTL